MNRPKLQLKEKVEVRQFEEGLGGSWHPGVVVGVLDMCREVQYDELLCENGNAKLIEFIPVTEEIDGIYQRPSKKIYHRGRIRPLPSKYTPCSKAMRLKFGVCVDALFEDAWWEGVIYDCDDSSDERMVFFPDEDDHMMFKLADLRITCEWDEFSGNWKQRGVWNLAKLALELKTDFPLSDFVDRVWSRLQENYGFLKMISEWTCGAHSVWKVYFVKVVNELAIKSVHRGSRCSITSQPIARRKNDRIRFTRSRHTQKDIPESKGFGQTGAEAGKGEASGDVPLAEEQCHATNFETTKVNNSVMGEGDTKLLVDSALHNTDEIPGTDRNTNDATTSGRLIKMSRKQSQHGYAKRKKRLIPKQVKKNLVKDLAEASIGRNINCRASFPSFGVRKKRSCLKFKRRFPKRIQITNTKAKHFSRIESGILLKDNIATEPIASPNRECDRTVKDGSNTGKKRLGRKRKRYDSVCFVCHCGDDLLPCDNCSSSYHATCTGLKEVPVGYWFCPSCRCGLCGLRSTAGAAKFTKVCYQCSRQYHLNCLDDRNYLFSDNHLAVKFCSRRCFEICGRLHNLIQSLNPTPVEGLAWTVVRSRRNGCNIRDERVHPQVQLSQVMSVMHECFEPAVEPHTNKDLVPQIAYNSISRFRRLDFHGFYIMTLLQNEEVACVATLRIHGKKVAEMPLVATPFRYRRRGMCRLLLYEIEKLLIDMGVERLVLPAISQQRDMWVNAFGFMEMPAELRQELSGYPFLVFNGTTMLHKVVSESNLALYAPHFAQERRRGLGERPEENQMMQDKDSRGRFGLHYYRRQRSQERRKDKVMAKRGSYMMDQGSKQNSNSKENVESQVVRCSRNSNDWWGREKMQSTAQGGSIRDEKLLLVKYVYKRRRVLAGRQLLIKQY